jgi:hypothetical protein
MIRIPEDDAGVSKHVGVLTIYKIFLIYIYIYTHVCVYVCVCVYLAFVGLANKLHKMHGTYINICLLAVNFSYDMIFRAKKSSARLPSEGK